MFTKHIVIELVTDFKDVDKINDLLLMYDGDEYDYLSNYYKNKISYKKLNSLILQKCIFKNRIEWHYTDYTLINKDYYIGVDEPKKYSFFNYNNNIIKDIDNGHIFIFGLYDENYNFIRNSYYKDGWYIVKTKENNINDDFL